MCVAPWDLSRCNHRPDGSIPVAAHSPQFVSDASENQGTTEAPSATLVDSAAVEASQRRAFALLNAVVLPWWLAMILAPRSRVTAGLMARLPMVLAALGMSYVGLLVRAIDGGLLDDLHPDALSRGLARPDAFLAGWAHYVAFDVFVGRWIWRTAVAERRGCRVALLTAMLFGPAGLLLFMAQRRLRPRRS
jgi:Domain of unknown function (DUF4281)